MRPQAADQTCVTRMRFDPRACQILKFRNDLIQLRASKGLCAVNDSVGAFTLQAHTPLHRICQAFWALLVARNCPRDFGPPQGRPAWSIAKPLSPAYRESLAVLGDPVARNLRIVGDAGCRNARPWSCHLSTRLLSERDTLFIVQSVDVEPQETLPLRIQAG